MESNNIAKSIGKKIKIARLKKELTQEELAEICEVSTNHICSIENGASNCSFNLMIKICKTLHITPNYLLLDFIKESNNSDKLIDSELLLTYMKLKPKYRSFINDIIKKIYNIQNSKN